MSPSSPTSPPSNTYERLCAILAKDYKLTPEQLTPDAPLESLGIDSLGVADLLFNVEDEFGISLPPEPVQLETVGEVAAFIDRLIAAPASFDGSPPSSSAPPQAS
ncbi:MAG: phosphopantetheine-binding protein [Pseudomonadota bacterium]